MTQDIQKYEKSKEEVIEKIEGKSCRSAIQSISFLPLESSRIQAKDYEPSIFKRLFGEKPLVSTQTKLKMHDIIDPLVDAEINKKIY